MMVAKISGNRQQKRKKEHCNCKNISKNQNSKTTAATGEGNAVSVGSTRTKTCGVRRRTRKPEANEQTHSGPLCFGLLTRLKWLTNLTTGNQNFTTKTRCKSSNRQWENRCVQWCYGHRTDVFLDVSGWSILFFIGQLPLTKQVWMP